MARATALRARVGRTAGPHGGMPCVVATFLLLTTNLLTTNARADVDEDRIARGRAALEDQRYDAAIHEVRSLLRSPATPPRARLQALEVTAIAHLVLGRSAQARTPLAQLYDLAPGFALEDPSLPPRVTAAFEAEAALPHARAVTPTLAPTPTPTTTAGGGAREARARQDARDVAITVGGNEVKDVRVACRANERAAFAPMVAIGSVAAPDGTTFRFRMPTAERHVCHAVAVDANQLPLGRLGTARAPFVVEAPPPAPAPAPSILASTSATEKPPQKSSGPITGTWWFWTAAAAVAAGTVAVVYVGTRPSDPGAPPVADITTTARAFAW